MVKEELIELFKDNKLSQSNKISAAALANIMKFAMVNLQLDGKTLDYYYEIDIDELLESEMPNEEYEVMKSQGWALNNDKLITLL